MMRLLRYINILIFLCFVTCAYADNWTTYKKAEIRSKEKNIFRIDCVSNSSVRAWLILRNAPEGVFKSKLPIYQIDKNEIHNLEQKKKKKVNEDRWIRWIISERKGMPESDLLEFMNGNEVTFQYYLPDGSIKESTFSLEGAREAIQEILK